MDSLVALGVGTAFVYSTVIALKIIAGKGSEPPLTPTEYTSAWGGDDQVRAAQGEIGLAARIEIALWTPDRGQDNLILRELHPHPSFLIYKQGRVDPAELAGIIEIVAAGGRVPYEAYVQLFAKTRPGEVWGGFDD